MWLIPWSEMRNVVRGALFTAAILTGSIAAAWFTIDYSFDGLYYHQEIIAALCDGWNPFAPPFDAVPPYTVWAVHYAKAVEIAAASVVSFTGHIETGKAVNLIIVAGMAMAVWSWASALRPLASHRLVITLAATANPVVIAQLFTYYIDFYKYVYLIFVLISLSDIYAGYRRGYVVLCMTLILAMATKFNIFFEAGIWILAAMIWWGLRRETTPLRRVLLTGIVAFVIGGVLTFHPYVTNWLSAGHPLYPLMGDGAEDIMTDNTPAAYLGVSRFLTFFMSVFSFHLPDVAQLSGGFSPFMPVILVLTAWLLFGLRDSIRPVAIYIIAVVFISCFFFEQAWWARYICQLWLVPVMTVAAAYYAGRSPEITRLTAWLMIAAGAMTLIYAGKQMIVVGGYQKLLLEAAAEEPEVTVTGPWWGPQFQRQMDEAGVSYTFAPELPDTTGRVALYFHECTSPLIVMSPEGADKIRSRIEGMYLNFNRHVYGSPESKEYISRQ